MNGCCFGKIWDGMCSIRFPLLSSTSRISPAAEAHFREGLIAIESPRVSNLINQFNLGLIDAQAFNDKLTELLNKGIIDSHQARVSRKLHFSLQEK